MNRFAPLLTLIALIALIAISVYKLNSQQGKNISAGNNAATEIGFFNETNFELENFSIPDLYIEGKSLTQENFKGHYSLINFFASWCTTCRAEHDVLLRLQKLGIIKMYGIAWRDIDVKTKYYLRQAGNPFEQIGKDSKGIFTQIAGINAIPETWIVNPDGVVVARLQGNLQEFMIEEISRIISDNS